MTILTASSEPFQDADLIPFLSESLRIEGITQPPSDAEINATRRFLRLFSLTAAAVGDLQAVYAPGKPLRERVGMDVRVGDYIAPPGGPAIIRRMQAICRKANRNSDPWKTHIEFETLHPYLDGNGRTGRAIWLWQMNSQGKQPFALPFLHRYYYDTLRLSR